MRAEHTNGWGRLVLGLRVMWRLSLVALLGVAAAARGERPLIGELVLEDSEEPYDRRIYAYDFGVDSAGHLHVVYARPVPGASRTDIVYAHGPMADLNGNKQILSADGKHGSISVHLLVDDNDTVHVSYILHPDDPETGLYYQTLRDGVASPAVRVADGGWHTKMALDAARRPLFVRDDVMQPRIYLPTGSGWSSRLIPLTVPARYYRVCDFAYDVQRGVSHLTFGDRIDDQMHCGGSGPACSCAYFSRFHYASSSDFSVWRESTVYDQPRLCDWNYWTAMVLDASDGEIFVGSWDMNPYYAGNPPNANLLWGWKSPSAPSFATRVIAGTNCPPDLANAGMGAGFAIDAFGRFWGAWDNSPSADCNIFGPQPRGATALAYSPNGYDWTEYQLCRPFSTEGYVRARIFNDRLYILFLGDWTDAKLYLLGYQLDSPIPPPPPVTEDDELMLLISGVAGPGRAAPTSMPKGVNAPLVR